MKRHYGWVMALLAFLVAIAGLYVELNRPGPETREEQELRSAIPPKVATHCHRFDNRREDTYSFLSLVVARFECQPVDPGPEYVDYVSFANEGAQRKYMRGYEKLLVREGAYCALSYLRREPWIDSRGKTKGELLCDDSGHHSSLIWSERQGREGDVDFLAAVASSKRSDEARLHSWWQRDVKFNGDGAPRQMLHRLVALLPGSFGHCVLDSEGLPSALVAVHCEPQKGISSTGAALFPDQPQLEAHMEAFASVHPGATKTRGCNESTFGFTTYGAGKAGKPTEGKLFCYVNEGVQWFVWSANHPHVFAYAGRNDENWGALYQEWSHSLSFIRHLTS